MSDQTTEWGSLVNWALERFEHVDTIPALMIPWGDQRDEDDRITSGLMVDLDQTPEGRPAWRIGVYGDLSAEHVAMAYEASVDGVVDAIEYLTEHQPEGTDWAAWAAQRVEDTPGYGDPEYAIGAVLAQVEDLEPIVAMRVLTDALLQVVGRMS